jgi:uncharacterized protein (TIGR03000 family)
MFRISCKYLLIGAVVALGLSTVTTKANAQCCGWSRPVTYSYAYPRVWAPYYYTAWRPYAWDSSSCCDGNWYLGWRHGPIRRLLLGHCRWYWGSSGWCCNTVADSCCGDTVTTTPCCGNDTSTPTPPAPAANQPTPAQKPVIDPPALPGDQAPTPAPEPAKSSATSNGSSGTLSVYVPDDAKVQINGRDTHSTGSYRQYVSHGLKDGLSYKYVIRAEVVRNGQAVEDTRTVILTAGQTTAVAFDFNGEATTNLASR